MFGKVVLTCRMTLRNGCIECDPGMVEKVVLPCHMTLRNGCIECDPGMVRKVVLTCRVTSLYKWSIGSLTSMQCVLGSRSITAPHSFFAYCNRRNFRTPKNFVLRRSQTSVRYRFSHSKDGVTYYPGQKKRPLRLCIKSKHCSYHAISA